MTPCPRPFVFCINALSSYNRPVVAKCKSNMTIAAHRQQHERSTGVFTAQQQPHDALPSSFRVASMLCPGLTVSVIVECKSIVSIASHKQHERSTGVCTAQQLPRGCVAQGMICPGTTVLSLRNANPTCQSLRIGSNMSAPQSFSPKSSNQHDALLSSLGVVSILCPGTTVLDIA
jgi:hypothetical protein